MLQYRGVMTDMFDFATARDGSVIEGFLGERNEARVLFLLREPDDPDAQIFWMRKVLDDERFRRGRGPKYADTLSALARHLLGCPDAIRRCAYINLYAAGGESSASRMYGLTYRAFRGETLSASPADKAAAETRAAQVKGLLRDFVTSGTEHIVTVGSIYQLLRGMPGTRVIRAEEDYDPSEKLTLRYRRKGIHEKTFRRCECEMLGRRVNLHEFWHPSYPTYRLDALREAIPDCFDVREPG